MAIKAVIFDLDGTITQPFFDFGAIREEMGLNINDGPILEAMEKMTPEQRRRIEEILHFHEDRAVEESELNDGAKETLEILRKSKIPVGILTRNKRCNAEAIAKKYRLKFDEIVDRDDGPVKPDAFGVLELCRRFGVKPAETLVVGDYLFDLLCAKAAGAVSVLLATHDDWDDFTGHADFVIDMLEEVLGIIEEENGNGTQLKQGDKK
jgi:HAD superfamily hydrolase (TIGR01509 family)